MAEQKVELRRIRDFSENLNDTILFIRQNFKPLVISFLTIAGVFMLASAILAGIYQSQFGAMFKDILERKNNKAVLPTDIINGNYFLVLIFSWLNFVAMQVAVISYIKVYEVKHGDTPQVNEVWDVFKRYFFKVFFYSIPLGLLTIVGLMLCLLPGIYFAVVFVPFSVILIMEDQTLGGAYNRCFTLVKDNFWISLSIYFLTYLISAFCGGIISAIVGGITSLLSYFTTKDINVTAGIVASILNVFSFIFYIVYYVSACLHYFTLSEKYDGTGMMRKLDSLGGNDQHFDNIQEQF
jgi:hypothetical protein